MLRGTEQGGDAIRTFRNDRLTYRLNLVAQQAIAANDPIFVRETGCTLRELRVLRLICDEPGVSFAEIARMTGLERSLTSRLIQKLLKAKLIERRNSEQDARVFLLEATPEGLEVRARAREVANRLEAILTEPLAPDERAALDRYLERLALWIDAPDYRDALEEAAEALSR